MPVNQQQNHRIWPRLIFVLCLAVAGAEPDPSAAAPHESIATTSPGAKGDNCPKGMKTVLADDEAGNICEPPGASVASRTRACLSAGMEAVMVPQSAGVFCTRAGMGEKFLDRKQKEKDSGYQHPHQIDAETICREKSRPAADRRILDRHFIKELAREADSIDPRGIRVIGGIFCDGLDLIGLTIPFSIVLDQSIFLKGVDLRNFHTSGDFAADNSVFFDEFRFSRAKVKGSVYLTLAFMQTLKIEDSEIGGSVKLHKSIIKSQLNIESSKVEGDVDVYASFFSYFMVLRNQIDGALDLSQTQARCSYDIRKNKIGDVIATQFGFGDALNSRTDEPGVVYAFRKISGNSAFGRPLPDESGNPMQDPYDRYADQKSTTRSRISSTDTCNPVNLIREGTFALIDNHVNSSICIRAFNWMNDRDGTRPKTNVYLNENVVGDATWLDFSEPSGPPYSPAGRRKNGSSESDHVLSIFNVRTGTLILNFELVTGDVQVEVNGLDFDRVYSSTAECESAIALRATRRPTKQRVDFPPRFTLPTVPQVIAWIQKNKFAGTQQPFAEFVAVFERAGNAEAAKELRITSEDAALKSSLCNLLPWSEDRCASSGAGSKPGEIGKSDHWTIWGVIGWSERAIVTSLKFTLWFLAEHGYKPERVGWFVLLTVVGYWLIFRYFFRIVGYSVEDAPDKIRPVGAIFLFDKMLPAYRIREEHYKQKQFYVVPPSEDGRSTTTMRRFWRDLRVAEADERETKRAEMALAWLRLFGIIFAIFLVAAISRLVR
jgi:hypothetical protein